MTTATTQQNIDRALTQTKTAITKFFDTIDNIDRKLYGKKMKFFIWGSLLVLIIAPILDEFLKIPHDRLTYYSTLVFFIFTVIVILSWVGSWRDDNGNWTWKRAKSRLIMYYHTTKDNIATTRTNSRDENLFKLGQFLFIGGICWKAVQNLSVFIRKPVENLFNTRLVNARKFEHFTNHWYWIALLIGLGIIIYLYYNNPKILERIKGELRQLFSWGRSSNSYKGEIVRIEPMTDSNLVINAKQDEQVRSILSTNHSKLFNDFILALKEWRPRGAYYEYEFQDRLYRHLKKSLDGATIQLEYPIGSKEMRNKGRADVVINDTILIEMKSDSSRGAIQRAKGQILQYSDIWRDKGPVILLLCNYNYDQAKIEFASTMSDLVKLQRPVMTIVAKLKK